MTTGGAPVDGLAVLATRLRLAAQVCEEGAAADAASSLASSTTALRLAATALADHPALHRLVQAAGTEPALAGRSPRWQVRLMGEFAVTVDARDATPARGNGAAIVKLLALRGPMSADALVDVLWPTADPLVGSARLRNTLSRLRRTTGDIAVRRGGLLALHPAAHVDAVDFLREAAAALQGCRAVASHAGVDRVTSAIAAYGGELLPGDRFVEWFDHDRDHLLRRYLELTDVAVSDAERRGDVHEAIDILEAAMAADPLDEQRAVRLAGHLVALGHRAAARWSVERAVGVARELGVAPSAELRRLTAVAGVRSAS